ncbi:MAG TPA: dephospho-CoA kinase [bacterium]|nr:dephospho-CoA kinase [bacterium]
MKIYALTGGIASGKSTVAAMFRDLGAAVIDADKVAHRVYAKGSPLYRELRRRYGRSILRPSGGIDRKRLARILFSSAKEKSWLEGRIHPETRRLIGVEIQKALRRRAPLVLVEAALHVETGYHRAFPAMITVSSGGQKQLQRLVEREALDLAEAKKRVASQFPEKEKNRRADWVIDNSGSLAKTRAQVKRLFKRLVKGGE